jgi:exo-beta-1,3-glucanase (GH17 family)
VNKFLKAVSHALTSLLLAPLLFQSTPAFGEYRQMPSELLNGQVMAVAYSGFREGQYPDRGDGAVNPNAEQILEDLNILAAHQFNLIRIYDSGENSATTLRLIQQHKLPIKVLLGIWLEAEVSNHEGCAWLDTPIPAADLAANTLNNAAEIDRGINLAKQYSDIVIAVNVGNEALVEWNDHMVTLPSIINYVRRVKEKIKQPVTVADNYLWWIRDGSPLAAEVDFIGVHTYPIWENKTIDQALAYTIKNIEDVHRALPDKPIAVLEGGWATTATEFSEQANEANQARYFREVAKWAKDKNITFMFFEAFDEPWKGNPDNPEGAEKHWGLFKVNRTAKQVMLEIK